jgi:Carboxypeptidase regulatory-like domain
MAGPRFARVGFLVVLAVLLMPAVTLAQSAITGLVTDATGAVLPGVTVEARSPALIEQTRSTVSDANGRYRIEELRPGTYSVTFSLPGFSHFLREGIVLESEFTATINAQLKVGSLEETVTVSGASPVVDVQSTMSRTVLSKEQMEALPSGRSYQSLAATIPALGSALAGRFDVGGSTQMWQGTVVAYGSQSGDMALEIDGMNVASMLSTGQISGIYHNQAAYEEMSYQVVAGSAESQTGGVRINMIPKQGGNRFTWDAVATYSNEDLQADNNDAELQAKGLVVPPNLHSMRDYNFSIGGPLKRDKVWFFFSPRIWGAQNYILNQYFPDGSPAKDESLLQSYTTRITAQLTQKNKITALYDPLPKHRDYFLSETGLYDLKGSGVQNMYSHAIQAKWTSTVTNRLLVEAGYSENYTGYKIAAQDDVQGPSATNPWGDIAKSDSVITSKTFYNAPTQWFENPLMSRNIVGSVSHVTGSHSLKMGTQWRFGYITADRENNGHLVQVYNNGRPLAVSLYNFPIVSRSELNADFGVYIQDTWQLGRLTLNPGLRFERFNGEVAEQTAPAGRFVAERHFDRIPNLPNYTDWVPRFGAAYDLTGNGKTGLKFSVGRYMEQDASAFPERYNPMTLVPASVSWTDLNSQAQNCLTAADKTGCNDIADGALGCTYLTAGCEMNFAQVPATFGVRRNRNPDPDLERPNQLVWNAGISREIRPGFGISANYYRRQFYDITFTTDLDKPLSVYTPYQVRDPRGNGQMMTVYNIDPVALRSLTELDTTSSNNTSVFNSVDVGVNLRFGNGVMLNGGTATGRSQTTTCDVTDPNSTWYCDDTQFDVPWRTTFKMSGLYPLPWGIRLSGVFQSTAGDRINQTYQVTPAVFLAQTGVPMGQSSVTLRLNEPGSVYADRVNQLDFTLAKTFIVNRIRLTPEVSLFNMLNANPIVSQTTAFGPALGNPLRILEGRLIRFGFQARF